MHSLSLSLLAQSLLMISTPIILRFFSGFMRISDFALSKTDYNFKCTKCLPTFDFIVVGGGSAGAAVAGRLVEDGHTKVLLLEAGGDPHPLTNIPYAVTMINEPEIDWVYETVPQNGSAFGMQNQRVFWPRGKSLGGSSNANFMIYMRGNARDYDNWAKITGDPRWSFFNVEKIFRRMEDYHGVWGSSPFHSRGGPLRVEPPRYSPSMEYLLAAATEFGYPNSDPNSHQTDTFAPIDFTQRRGSRFSTYRAYIQRNLHRPNFIIHRYSHATKIHFDHEMRAVGVTYFRHGIQRYAAASKEVIICGGAINSPQLLMLSGIGPKEHLLQHGIVPLVDLPGVGQNLQDHVSTQVGPFLLNKPVSFLAHRDLNAGAIANYLFKGTGPLTLPNLVAALGLTTTQLGQPGWPNVMYTVSLQGVSPGLDVGLESAQRTRPGLFQTYLRPFLGQPAHFIVQTLGLPKSRGEIKLQSSNPFVAPLINPRYYSDEYGIDMNNMIDGMETLIKIYEQSHTLGGQLGAHLAPVHFPGCETYAFKSRPYLECMARTLTLTLYHPAGSCSMGIDGDPWRVVDSELRVIGTKGLRIADASIMPQVTNTNTNAPAIMIGEMCADMVKQAWSLFPFVAATSVTQEPPIIYIDRKSSNST